MEQKPTQDINLLSQRIRDSLQSVDSKTTSLRQSNKRLLAATLSSSAGATLVSGLTVIFGPLVGSGIPGWRLACTVAALLTLVATICTGFEQQIKMGDRLAEANQCLARMRALDLAIVTGSRPWEQISKDYEDTMLSYPDLV